jgi:hypothetical protein
LILTVPCESCPARTHDEEADSRSLYLSELSALSLLLGHQLEQDFRNRDLLASDLVGDVMKDAWKKKIARRGPPTVHAPPPSTLLLLLLPTQH